MTTSAQPADAGAAIARAVLAGRGQDAPGAVDGARQLGLRLAVCAPLAIATIALAMVPAAQFRGWQWVSLLLATPVATWGAWPLHSAAWRGLGHGAATMDTLVSLGVAVSFCWSVYALLFGGAGQAGLKMPFALTFSLGSGQPVYLEAAAGVTVAVLTGRYLETRAKAASGSALTALDELGVRDVRVLRDGTERIINADLLQVGDNVVVWPGEKIAIDGVVTGGASAVDTALITGESVPQEVTVGDEVTGGTMNLTGRLVISATRVGAETTLATITRLVTEALASKARAPRLADRVAAVFVPCVIALAVVTLGFWLGVGLPGASAWSACVAVLVVACPCALGLATPTALMAAIGRGAELGILVRSVQSLETAGRLRALVLDKTGTLTTGVMTIHQVTTGPGCDRDAVLRRAGAVESASGHPAGQVGDTLRCGAIPAVSRLRRLGLVLFVVTGDSRAAASAVASQLGVPGGNVIDSARPDAKARVVRELQAAGYPVAMAGDGINDAAALAAADLGMAMASATNAAIGASDLTLTSADPGVIADAIQLARATMAVIRINLAWAFGYNVLAIPLAALGYLNPLLAGIAMSASSLIVVSNSLLLRRYRPGRGGR